MLCISQYYEDPGIWQLLNLAMLTFHSVNTLLDFRFTRTLMTLAFGATGKDFLVFVMAGKLSYQMELMFDVNNYSAEYKMH